MPVCVVLGQNIQAQKQTNKQTKQKDQGTYSSKITMESQDGV